MQIDFHDDPNELRHLEFFPNHKKEIRRVHTVWKWTRKIGEKFIENVRTVDCLFNAQSKLTHSLIYFVRINAS